MQEYSQKINKQTIHLKFVAHTKKDSGKCGEKGEGTINQMLRQGLEIWSNQVQNQLFPVVQFKIYSNM